MKKRHTRKKVIRSRHNIRRSVLPKKPQGRTVTGIFTGNAKGFGFVTPDEGRIGEFGGRDIFIPANAVAGAFHKDRVEIQINAVRNDARPEGAVVRILERGRSEIVGTFVRKKNGGWVFPEDTHYDRIIMVRMKDAGGAADRDKVVVEIKDFGNQYENPTGRITEIIGHEGEPGADILTIARAMDIPLEFPERVINQAERVPDHVIEGDLNGREDLREWQMVTIDGPYARDLDDAVSLTKTGSGYLLGVHIADVSNYVQENSALDREALKRGTSVYLADRVIPMLPERLSNGICSLNAGCDRLALSVIMELNSDGAVEKHRVVESVINVNERMSYPDVQRILELKGVVEIPDEKTDEALPDCIPGNGDQGKGIHAGDSRPDRIMGDQGRGIHGGDSLPDCIPGNGDQGKGIHTGDSNRDTDLGDEEILAKYEPLIPMLCHMYELSVRIREGRKKRGAIDFDFPEAKILLDERGLPTDVLIEKANDATRLIEDFMLTANETVAKEFSLKQIPFVYRVHGEPDPEKIEKVLEFVRRQGIEIRKTMQHITPLEIQRTLESVKGEPAEAMVSYVILRAMQQARYDDTCGGHFGLAAKYYCHFTSPIRRYPDLQIHRIIHDCIRGRMTPEKMQHYRDILGEVSNTCSMTERRAAECERETGKLKKAEYMYERIGEEFEGRISSLTGWGMYVELPNTIEGLVRLTDMTDDYYSFDETLQAAVGRLSGKMYRIGDKVKVVVKDADLRMHTVDFELA